MAVKQYTYIRIYKKTKEQLDKRSAQANRDLKMLGINKAIPKIRFIDEVANRLTFISDRDLVKLASPRKCKLC